MAHLSKEEAFCMTCCFENGLMLKMKGFDSVCCCCTEASAPIVCMVFVSLMPCLQAGPLRVARCTAG